MASAVPSGLDFALLARALSRSADLHFTCKGWPPLYLKGLASIIPGRAALHYTWKGWPPLDLPGLASIVPGRAGLLLYLVVPQIVEGGEASPGHYFSLATGLHLLPSLWIYSSKKGLLS